MQRAIRSKLSPWIEQMIRDYGGEQGNGSAGRLKAHVIGVGHVSLSQGQSCESPAGLLFLSDSELQIPAVLTASAWEKVQEQEDRECLSSLVNTTVCVQDYRLQFHMAPEQTRCRFFLSVGELATTAAGPVKVGAPCCTTLPSVRLKIVKTWRALLGVEDSQKSQSSGFDLSELLGEWQHECLQAVLQDVRDRMIAASACPKSPRACSSVSAPVADAVATTGWDIDRVRYKSVKHFSVPVKCLLLPEEAAPQRTTPPSAGSRTSSGFSVASEDRNGDAPQCGKPSNAVQASAVDTDRHSAGLPAAAERGCDSVWDSPPHLHEDALAAMVDSHIRPLANPWDIFPPPCDTSSESSPEATPPPHSLHKPAIVTLTGIQLPVHNSKESQQVSEHSFLPLYQQPPDSTSPHATDASSGAAHERRSCTAQQSLPALEQKSRVSAVDVDVDVFERTHRKAKRKRSESAPEALSTLAQEVAQVSRSPPSWLFDTQAGRRPGQHKGRKQGPSARPAFRNTSTVHSDGSSFSYSYRVSGGNLQDLSQFTVNESLLQWAVKVLVASKPTDNPHNILGKSPQAPSARSEGTEH